MRLLLSFVAGLMVVGTTVFGAPTGDKNKTIDGYEWVAVLPKDVRISTPKPPYPYDVRVASGELVMVARLFIGRSGQIDRATSVGFWGDPRLVSHTLDFVRANWRVIGQPPRPFYKDVPVIFQMAERSSWATAYLRGLPKQTTAERCAELLRYIKEQRRKSGRSGPPLKSAWWEEYAR